VNDRANKQRVIEVRNPYSREVVGTVPKATVAEVRKALSAAHAYKPKLTRYERAAIMQKAATLLRERRLPISSRANRAFRRRIPRTRSGASATCSPSARWKP